MTKRLMPAAVLLLILFVFLTMGLVVAQDAGNKIDLAKLDVSNPKDREQAKKFFSSYPEEVGKNKIRFGEVLRQEGVSIQVLGPVKAFTVDGVITGTNGMVNVRDLRSLYDFIIEENGGIALLEKGTKVKHVFEGNLVQAKSGISLESGSIDGAVIKEGSNLKFVNGQLTGMAKGVKGVTFESPALFEVDGKDGSLLSRKAVISSITGDVVIKGEDISLPEGGKLEKGALKFVDGKPTLLEKNSVAVIDNWRHSTKDATISLSRVHDPRIDALVKEEKKELDPKKKSYAEAVRQVEEREKAESSALSEKSRERKKLGDLQYNIAEMAEKKVAVGKAAGDPSLFGKFLKEKKKEIEYDISSEKSSADHSLLEKKRLEEKLAAMEHDPEGYKTKLRGNLERAKTELEKVDQKIAVLKGSLSEAQQRNNRELETLNVQKFDLYSNVIRSRVAFEAFFENPHGEIRRTGKDIADQENERMERLTKVGELEKKREVVGLQMASFDKNPAQYVSLEAIRLKESELKAKAELVIQKRLIEEASEKYREAERGAMIAYDVMFLNRDEVAKVEREFRSKRQKMYDDRSIIQKNGNYVVVSPDGAWLGGSGFSSQLLEESSIIPRMAKKEGAGPLQVGFVMNGGSVGVVKASEEGTPPALSVVGKGDFSVKSGGWTLDADGAKVFAKYGASPGAKPRAADIALTYGNSGSERKYELNTFIEYESGLSLEKRDGLNREKSNIQLSIQKMNGDLFLKAQSAKAIPDFERLTQGIPRELGDLEKKRLDLEKNMRRTDLAIRDNEDLSEDKVLRSRKEGFSAQLNEVGLKKKMFEEEAKSIQKKFGFFSVIPKMDELKEKAKQIESTLEHDVGETKSGFFGEVVSTPGASVEMQKFYEDFPVVRAPHTFTKYAETMVPQGEGRFVNVGGRQLEIPHYVTSHGTREKGFLLDVELFSRAQTCADSCMYMHGLYQLDRVKKGMQSSISFPGYAGSWTPSSGADFKSYMSGVFEAVNTGMLRTSLQPVSRAEDLRAGDVITLDPNGQGYGHTIGVKRVFNVEGSNYVETYQGTDPAVVPEIAPIMRLSDLNSRVKSGSARLHRWPEGENKAD